jgi:hypothetical protein
MQKNPPLSLISLHPHCYLFSMPGIAEAAAVMLIHLLHMLKNRLKLFSDGWLNSAML